MGARWYWGQLTSISDQDPADYNISGLSPRTYELTITETSNKGTFYSDNTTPVAGKTFSYVGTKTQVNNWKLLKQWVPTATGTATFTMSLVRLQDGSTHSTTITRIIQ